jgi:DNA-binding transcriptional ArsR family regulator
LHLDQWAHWNGVQLDFSRPGRPSDNGFCESFNNRVRQELLNPTWFRSIDDARRQAAAWRHDYNANHPHSSLDNLSPQEFARCAKKKSKIAAASHAHAASGATTALLARQSIKSLLTSLSRNTVSNHLKVVYQEFGVYRRYQTVVKAVELGYATIKVRK